MTLLKRLAKRERVIISKPQLNKKNKMTRGPNKFEKRVVSEETFNEIESADFTCIMAIQFLAIIQFFLDNNEQIHNIDLALQPAAGFW